MISMAGHMVKQLPQYMHFSSVILTLLFFGSGLMAAVGQLAITVEFHRLWTACRGQSWAQSGEYLKSRYRNNVPLRTYLSSKPWQYGI
jgi:fatty-acid desaturase